MMIQLTKWAEGYPLIKLDSELIETITAANRRPYWSEGFYRDCADITLRGGGTLTVAETPDEVERRMGRQVDKTSIADVLTRVAQVFDGWHADGTAWSEWDKSVRQEVSELLARLRT